MIRWSMIQGLGDRNCYEKGRGKISAEKHGTPEHRQHERKFQEQTEGDEIRQKQWTQAQEYGPKKEASIQDHTICLEIREDSGGAVKDTPHNDLYIVPLTT
jgi:hypothetical protein